MNRIKTGIIGLDPLVDGGFLEGQTVLVCGSPGTGKTIFGLQFLYKGATEEKQNGLYVNIEDNIDKLRFYANGFGWNVEKLEKENKLMFLKVPIDHKGFKIVDAIAEKAKEIKAKGIVIDSLSAISINAKMYDLPLRDHLDPTGTIKGRILHTAGYVPFEDLSQFTYLFIYRLSDLGATTLCLADAPTGAANMLTNDGVSESVCDGLVHLQLHDAGKIVNRTISIKKLRGTNIIPGMNSLKFTKTGLEVGEFKACY